jgi:hypothetical protein
MKRGAEGWIASLLTVSTPSLFLGCGQTAWWFVPQLALEMAQVPLNGYAAALSHN